MNTNIWSHRRALFLFALCGSLWMGNAGADGPDQEPIPSFYQEPGLNPNRETVGHSANEHIDPFTGKLQWHFVDLSIPGNGGFTLTVQRSYSSRNEDYEPSPIGVGWTMHFGRVLRKFGVSLCDMNQSSSKSPVLELPEGSRSVLYVALGGTSFITTNRWVGDCGSGHFRVYSPEGTFYDMDVAGPVVGTTSGSQQQSWYPSKITDRNGNTMTLTYMFADGVNFGPQTVTTSDGRTVTFTYENGALKTVSDGSRSVSYTLTPIPGYLGATNLTMVTRPDSAAWQYEYNPPGAGPGQGTPGGFSMKKVTYPTGGVINYTYGFVAFNPASFFPKATVVTGKADSTSASWTYTYAPAVNPVSICGQSLCPIDSTADADKLDKTTVAAPDGNNYVYQHFGYTSANPGYVYLIGSLLFKWSGQVQVEGYSWGGQQISLQTNLRPGGSYIFDSSTYAPLLLQKSINRAGASYTTQFYDLNAPNLGFDAYGNPAKITEIGPNESGGTETRNTTVTYFIDPVKWIIHKKKDETTDTIGSITRTFDGNGNLLTENRYGVPVSYTYTVEGDILSKTDARSNSINYSSYFRGVPQGEAHPEGVSISRIVSNAGNVTSETDGEMATTSYGYDGLNRITSINHPLGNPVGVVWTPTSRTVTRGAFQEVTTFDSFGKRISVVHSGAPEGTITQTFGYDGIGRRIFASYPNSIRGTFYTYSAADHLLTVLHDSSSTGTGSTSGQGYFYSANTVRLTNERLKDFTYTYRGWGDPAGLELMKIDAPEPAASVVMTRNGLGKLTAATQDGRTRTYGYDTRYFLTSTTEPEVGQTIYGRDAVGNMTSRQVGSSPTTNFTYDGRNRLVTTTYPSGTPHVAPNVTRTYYKDDKLKSVDNTVTRRDFVYNANKSLTQETLTINGSAFVTAYAYDANDALNVMTYGSTRTVTYAPDALGRPTKALPYVTTISHHPTGQIKDMTYANGVRTVVELNNRNWPSKQTISQGTQYFNTTYAYQGNGNVSAIDDSVDPNYFRTMVYDGVDRITNVNNAPWGNGTFTYDGRGNILSQVLGSTFTMGYTYDGSTDRLSSTVGTKVYNFSYDVYGNVTGNGFTTFAYNDASQMACARCGQADEIAYQYDGLGLRTKVQQSGASTYFVYDANGRLLWERAPDMSIKEYIYLAGHQIATRKQTP